MKRNYEKNPASGLFRFSERLLCVFLFLCVASLSAKNETFKNIFIQGDAIAYYDDKEISGISGFLKIQGSAVIYNDSIKTRKETQKEKRANPQKMRLALKNKSFKKSISCKRKINLWFVDSSTKQDFFILSFTQNNNSVLPLQTSYGKPFSREYAFADKPFIFSEKLILYQYYFHFASSYLFPKIFCRPPTNFSASC